MGVEELRPRMRCFSLGPLGQPELVPKDEGSCRSVHPSSPSQLISLDRRSASQCSPKIKRWNGGMRVFEEMESNSTLVVYLRIFNVKYWQHPTGAAGPKKDYNLTNRKPACMASSAHIVLLCSTVAPVFQSQSRNQARHDLPRVELPSR